jgi:hypothetical protein
LARASYGGRPRGAARGLFTAGAFTVSAIVRVKLAALLALLFAHGHKNPPMSMEDVNVVVV